jgi:hypothetical protein
MACGKGRQGLAVLPAKPVARLAETQADICDAACFFKALAISFNLA